MGKVYICVGLFIENISNLNKTSDSKAYVSSELEYKAVIRCSFFER